MTLENTIQLIYTELPDASYIKKSFDNFLFGLVEEFAKENILTIEANDLLCDSYGNFNEYKEVTEHIIDLSENSSLEIDFELTGKTMPYDIGDHPRSDIDNIQINITKCKLYLFDGSEFYMIDNNDFIDWLANKLLLNLEIMTEDNKKQEQCTIKIIMCNSCDKEIKIDDDKHCFWYEDIEDGVKPECLDCHLDREAINRDFGF